MKAFNILFKIVGWVCVSASILFLCLLIKDLGEYSRYSMYGETTLLDIYVVTYLMLSFIICGIASFWLSEYSNIKAKEEKYYDCQLAKLKQNIKTQPITTQPIITQRLKVGEKFTIEDMNTHEISTYTIVEREQQDVVKGLISNDAPIARKVAESLTGDIVELFSGDKAFKFKILSKNGK